MRLKNLFSAFVAVRKLIRNPEDTPQVFRILSSLRGKVHERLYRRLQNTTVGLQVISGEKDLAKTLSDRGSLQHLPVGSLGRSYYEFTQKEELTAFGLVHASKEAMESISDDRVKRVVARMRDSHDLWHVVTAYGRDPLGEACLLSFTHAQTKNPAILFLLVMIYRRLSQGYGRSVFKTLRKARRDGLDAQWLPAVDWEALLDEPLEGVRRDLGIVAPISYQSILKTIPTPALEAT